MQLRTLGIILYLTFFGGAIGVLGKFALPALHPETLIFARLAISVLCFVPLLWWRHKIGESFRVLWEELPTFFALAATGIGGGMILGFLGLTRTTAVSYDLLFNTSAIFIVCFAALFFHEKITLRDMTLLSVAIVGTALIVTDGEFSTLSLFARWRGDTLVLLGALGWALYSMLGPHRARQHPEIDPLIVVFNTFFLGIIFLFPYILGARGFAFELLDLRAIFATLALGIFSTAILFYFWLQFVRLEGGLLGGFVTLGENLSGVLLPMLLLDERPSAFVVVGGALIVGAIIAKRN